MSEAIQKQVEKIRIFLLSRPGLDVPGADTYLVGLIEEGSATWEDGTNTLHVDCRPHGIDTAYRMRFNDDKTISVLATVERQE
jgi:hypothetical protein